MIAHAAAREGRNARRPLFVTALTVFFAFGAAISGIAFIALLFPGSPLEPMWRLNPRAREQFASMGIWAPVLMAVVCVLCSLTALGLLHGRRYGLLLGFTMLAVSLLGDLANALLGLEPRAWIGVPIAALLIAALASRSSRSYFAAVQR